MKIFDETTVAGRILNGRVERQTLAEKHIAEAHGVRVLRDGEKPRTPCCSRESIVAWIMGDDRDATPPWERVAGL